ncbi:MAG: hypothetical protein CO065_01105 [Comamonadaceae bacterium CG_4_9_14_0_8_um_filter_57_21]|nr:MAG: hypothetical protein CO065_01105 [Comamonadaceae bacterium CG_4_9_14_0_8_um_filter_57_21]
MTTATVKNVPLGTPLQVRARLMTLGWPSLSAWAKAHGHKPVTVNSAMKIWGQRSDRAPHGGLSRVVVRDLRATMDMGITPADVTPSVEGAQA